MQNIYDNKEFFTGYINLRESNRGLNDVLEIPAFRSLLPVLRDKVILDLGCGYGEVCKWYISQGASRVIGIDISKNMIQKAREIFSDSKIEYVNVAIEEYDFPKEQFDLVVSSLAFHYVSDFDELISNISNSIRARGELVFSQEHPIATAKKVPEGWVKDECGKKLHWVMDNYDEEGERIHKWIIDGVVKYHRTFSSIINTLIYNGLRVDRVLEPIAILESEQLDESLKEERRRPPFLLIKATKID